MGTHRQREPQQPRGTLGHTLRLGQLCLVLHCNEEAFQPHLSDVVSWSKKQTRRLSNHHPHGTPLTPLTHNKLRCGSVVAPLELTSPSLIPHLALHSNSPSLL